MKNEKELRAEWEKWNREAHPEDQMSFTDYLDEIGVDWRSESEDEYY